MSHESKERNKRIVILRYSDPETYSFSKLGELEGGLTKQTIQHICRRDWAKYLTKSQLNKRPTP